MGNLCSTSSKNNETISAMTLTRQSDQDQEQESIISQINSHFSKYPNSDLVYFKVKKTQLKALLEKLWFDVPRSTKNENTIDSMNLLQKAMAAIKQASTKTFIPINFQNDPNDSKNYARVILANENIQQRFDLDQYTVKQRENILQSIKAKPFTLTVDNIEATKEQIQSIVREQYEEKDSFLIGCVQDQKNINQVSFIFADPHKAFEYEKSESPSFYNVEYLENVEDLEEVLNTWGEIFIQTVVSLRDSQQNTHTFVVLKDLEFLLYGKIGAVEHSILDEKQFFNHLQADQDAILQNVQFIDQKFLKITYNKNASPRTSLLKRSTIGKASDVIFEQKTIELKPEQNIGSLITPVLMGSAAVAAEVIKNENDEKDDIEQANQIKIDVKSISLLMPKEEIKEVEIEKSKEEEKTSNKEENQTEPPVEEKLEEQPEEPIVETGEIYPNKEYKEIEFKEQEAPKSFILDFYSPQGLFKVNPHNAEKGEAVLNIDEEANKIYNTGGSVTCQKLKYKSTKQIVKISNKPLTRYEFEPIVNCGLEYIGAHELWQIYRFKIQNSTKQQFLYVSANQDLIPYCLYEVHFAKQYLGQQSIYQEEHVIKKDMTILQYAVVVTRPSLDLNSLFKIWNNEELSKRKSESYNRNKLVYIMIQALQILRNLQQNGIHHCLIRPSSFFVDMTTYTLSLGSFGFAQHQGNLENSQAGFLKSYRDIEHESINNKQFETITQLFHDYLSNEKIYIQDQLNNLVDLDSTLDNLKHYISQTQTDLLDIFSIEEKQQSAFNRLINILDMDHQDYKYYYFDEDDIQTEESIDLINRVKNPDVVFKLSQEIVKNYPIRDIIANLRQNPHQPSILFEVLHQMIIKGEIHVISIIKQEFLDYIENNTSFFGELTKIMINDFELYQSFDRPVGFENFTKRQKALYLILSQHGMQNVQGTIQKYLEDLDNECNTLTIDQYCIQNKIQPEGFSSDVPSYFQNKLQVLYGPKKPDQRFTLTQLNAEAVNRFKFMKQLVMLMFYQSEVTGISQYQATPEQTLIAAHRFALDLFKQNKIIYEEYKAFFAQLLDSVFTTQVLDDVLQYFTQVTLDQVKREDKFSYSAFARLNFIAHQMLLDAQIMNSDQIIEYHQRFFQKETYLQLISYRLDDCNDFVEYLAIVLGLREDSSGKLMVYQAKFLA